MYSKKIRILCEEDIRRVLPMKDAIETMKEAFRELSAGRVKMPARTHIDISAYDGTALFMPSYADYFGKICSKVVNVFDANLKRGLPSIQGIVCLLDGETGSPLAILNGTFLTALRTGAASGAATDLLARSDANTVAIIGAGAQGCMQLEAMCAVRSIKKVWIYDIAKDVAVKFAQKMSVALAIEIVVAESSCDALHCADIVCTATVSSTPVFADAEIAPGVHINAIGSYKPDVQEIPEKTVLRSLLVVDHRESALHEAGDLLLPIKRGYMQETHIHAELGEIIAGKVTGRTSDQDVTLFKSVGIAVQDLAAATRVLERAEIQGFGKMVQL
ncbi:MAG: ornithine cyclodeaminase family protein [Candidatus Hodarchaeota archaeon]